MKKLLNKIRKQKEPSPPSRITAETVAEHREKILAGGRKYKYPVQYARRKLVINATIISVVALVLAMVIGWWQLYPEQNTSELMYRVTVALPVPVANVDGQPVLYSDYLMKYRSSLHYLEQKEQVSAKSEDGKRQIEYIKQQSMADAIADAYAAKMANSLKVSVSDSELEGFLQEQRQTSEGNISEQTYNAVILDYYGWSPAEYRHVTEKKLLRQKVAYSIDKDAQGAINSVMDVLSKDTAVDFKLLAPQIASTTGLKVAYGTSGWVPKINQDGGLSIAAAKLTKSQISPVIKSTKGDGYYVIRLVDVNVTQLSYEYVYVPLSTFDNNLKMIENDSKISRYIDVPKS